MRVLLNFCALIFVLQKAKPSECSIKQAIFHRKVQNYFANHVIGTSQAESELECCISCVGDGLCASVNYKASGIGKGLCELNNKTLQEISNADGSMNNPEFNHLCIIKKV